MIINLNRFKNNSWLFFFFKILTWIDLGFEGGHEVIWESRRRPFGTRSHKQGLIVLYAYALAQLGLNGYFKMHKQKSASCFTADNFTSIVKYTIFLNKLLLTAIMTNGINLLMSQDWEAKYYLK